LILAIIANNRRWDYGNKMKKVGDTADG